MALLHACCVLSKLNVAMQGTTVTFMKEGRMEGGYGEVCPVNVSFQAAAKIPHDSAEAIADLHNEAAVLAAIPPHRHIIGSFGILPVPDQRNVLLLELAKRDLGDLHKCDLHPAASMLMTVPFKLTCQTLLCRDCGIGRWISGAALLCNAAGKHAGAKPNETAVHCTVDR